MVSPNLAIMLRYVSTKYTQFIIGLFGWGVCERGLNVKLPIGIAWIPMGKTHVKGLLCDHNIVFHGGYAFHIFS